MPCSLPRWWTRSLLSRIFLLLHYPSKLCRWEKNAHMEKKCIFFTILSLFFFSIFSFILRINKRGNWWERALSRKWKSKMNATWETLCCVLGYKIAGQEAAVCVSGFTSIGCAPVQTEKEVSSCVLCVCQALLSSGHITKGFFIGSAFTCSYEENTKQYKQMNHGKNKALLL